MDKTYTVIKGERGSGRIFHLERALSVKSAQLAAANKEVSRLEETNVSLQNTISILMCEVERLNEAQQWIPVTERLPEYGQLVIVYSGGVLSPQVFTQHFWRADFNDWAHITHWMPPPKPPKGE